MHDTIVANGVIVDPATGAEQRTDIAITSGRIAAIGPDLDTADARRIIDVKGALVTPGIIDLHAHVMHGVNANGVAPDLAGVNAGVTTVVDGGSAGAATFRAFPRYVMPAAKTEIIPFIHIGKYGLAAHPDIFATESVDVNLTRAVMEEHAGLIAGIKVRLVSPALDVFGLDMLRMARELADDTGTRLMVHIGDNTGRTNPSIIASALPILARGDIVTHLFTPNPGGVLEADGTPVPELRDAVDRGVILDTAHGDVNFSLDVARRALDAGVIPHCISTDLNAFGWYGVAPSMADVMTRFLGLGFTLAEVLAMCTTNPAAALDRGDRLGMLAVGRPADISVFDLRSGPWLLRDNFGGTLECARAFVPRLAIKAGAVHEPVWGPRPWGWEPERLAA